MKRSETTAGIDWEVLRRQTAEAAAATERAGEPDVTEARRILRARAQALARVPAPVPGADEALPVVEFVLAWERYAVEASYVRELVPLRELTPVPCTPAYVMGLISVRGEILSVIDIKKFFELPERGLGDLNKVIVLEGGGMRFGILADAIVGVRAVPRKDVQTGLPTLTGIRADYLLGVTSERLVVLDARALLHDRRLVVEEDVGP